MTHQLKLLSHALFLSLPCSLLFPMCTAAREMGVDSWLWWVGTSKGGALYIFRMILGPPGMLPRSFSVCCSVLRQCVAVCCSVLQCVAVRCSVLQCVAVCCSVLQCVAMYCNVLQCVAACCSVLQCVAVCCSVLQCVAVCYICIRLFVSCGVGLMEGLCSVFVQRSNLIAVCCSVLQCAVSNNVYVYIE